MRTGSHCLCLFVRIDGAEPGKEKVRPLDKERVGEGKRRQEGTGHKMGEGR